MILLQVIGRSRMLLKEEHSNIHIAFISNGWKGFKRFKKACPDWDTRAGIYHMKMGMRGAEAAEGQNLHLRTACSQKTGKKKGLLWIGVIQEG
jgi:hypothetical protein